jgi:succinate dehydrogenase/fumarate reductase flavoprotein subunit
VAEVKREIQRSMSAHALVVRSASGLERCLQELGETRAQLSGVAVGSVRELVGLFELENLLEVGELMVRAALFRTESRGSHFRADHPGRVAEWACPVFLRREAGGVRLAKGRFA